MDCWCMHLNYMCISYVGAASFMLVSIFLSINLFNEMLLLSIQTLWDGSLFPSRHYEMVAYFHPDIMRWFLISIQTSPYLWRMLHESFGPLPLRPRCSLKPSDCQRVNCPPSKTAWRTRSFTGSRWFTSGCGMSRGGRGRNWSLLWTRLDARIWPWRCRRNTSHQVRTWRHLFILLSSSISASMTLCLWASFSLAPPYHQICTWGYIFLHSSLSLTHTHTHSWVHPRVHWGRSICSWDNRRCLSLILRGDSLDQTEGNSPRGIRGVLPRCGSEH